MLGVTRTLEIIKTYPSAAAVFMEYTKRLEEAFQKMPDPKPRLTLLLEQTQQQEVTINVSIWMEQKHIHTTSFVLREDRDELNRPAGSKIFPVHHAHVLRLADDFLKRRQRTGDLPATAA
jgi:hypothetical protein